MVAKVLAGLLAAVAVTVVGVYAAFGTRGDAEVGSLPVSEGGCCAAQAQAAGSCGSLSASTCCAHEVQPAVAESVAACAGGAVLAVAVDGHGAEVE